MSYTCTTGKLCLMNESAAFEELAHVRAKYGEGPGTANGYYLCDFCGCYHLTSKAKDITTINSEEFKRRVRRLRNDMDWDL